MVEENLADETAQLVREPRYVRGKSYGLGHVTNVKDPVCEPQYYPTAFA